MSEDVFFVMIKSPCSDYVCALVDKNEELKVYNSKACAILGAESEVLKRDSYEIFQIGKGCHAKVA